MADYTIQAWMGKDSATSTLVKEFDSTQFGHRPSDNAFDVCRKFIEDNLDTHDYAKMVFTKLSEHGEHLDDLCWGAFTHPVRGRIKFPAFCKDFASALAEEQRSADRPLYSPREIYAMKPVDVSSKYVMCRLIEHWLPHSFNMSLYPEGMYKFLESQVESTGRIQLRYIANVHLGSDEMWTLCTLWFDDQSLAVLTYQGDDGTYNAYVTDVEGVRRMVDWVKSLNPPKDAMEEEPVVNIDEPLQAATEFYGHTLEEFYDVATCSPTPRV